MVLVAVFLAAVAAGVWALQFTKNSALWLSMAGTVAAIAPIVIGFLNRSPDQELVARVDETAGELASAVTEQWQVDVERRVGHPYPLPVPFAVPADAGKIMDGWPAIRGGADRTPIPLKGKFEEIADVFTRAGMPHRLVVLGGPGMGKSMIAQWLALKLLERGGATVSVPVLLPVARWNPAEPLEDWIAARMVETYPSLAQIVRAADGSARTLARELVARRRVLVILDGLDEMAPKNYGKALDKLSEAVREKHRLVVTCRTSEYREIVKMAHDGPLVKTPVIELAPLPITDVCAYLRNTDREPDARWDSLVDHLEAEPHGVLATVLSSALAVWLVRTVYGSADSTPGELIKMATPEEIMQHLLGGLVEASYTTKASEFYPKREIEHADGTHERLTFLARNLAAQENKQDIEWWQLHQMIPRAVIGLSVGLIVGSLLGVAVGLAVGIRAGSAAGLALGASFGIVTGVLSGITCMRVQEAPRAVNLRFSSGALAEQFICCIAVGLAVGLAFGYAADHQGGLWSGVITALVVGPVAGVAAGRFFGRAPGATAGITAGLALGLAAGLATGGHSGLLTGLIAGLVFMAGSWVWIGLYQPTKTAFAVSPEFLLKSDRIGCLVVGLTAGGAFGVVYGLALGLEVGFVAVVALTITVALTVSLWGTFNIARVWLAVVSGMPLGIMGFLQEAHDRGVLRQVGGVYQFRHIRLQEQLAAVPAAASATSSPASAAAAAIGGTGPN
jgi:hypothetical protein